MFFPKAVGSNLSSWIIPDEPQTPSFQVFYLTETPTTTTSMSAETELSNNQTELVQCLTRFLIEQHTPRLRDLFLTNLAFLLILGLLWCLYWFSSSLKKTSQSRPTADSVQLRSLHSRQV